MTASLPVWPFAILAGLVVLGIRQSRDRVVEPGAMARMALAMLVFSLYGVTTAFGTEPLPIAAWAAGFAASMFLGAPVLAPRGLAREGDAVRVPGSWLPLALMVGIFVAKFALGFAAGVGAHVVQQAWFVAVVSAALGMFSGAFAARAMAVQRFVRAR
ncbi:DUF6622 family protein [Roseateles saccharophilus]|uniref:Uncharacterized protein n=1 Tax=Roseateles saccharophilus TaxID=304 RepID=A0A4R3UMH4_ROSSA|nr:DUF6622 family protein [Roseateles saccharophilus]MDG0834267.1 tat pathway signal sequence [Roseateles saccharophilus]TCU91877.1 hypothetical protein EV671_102445 [Roseateles saccharophilus]